jgi:FlaA1/EpsC-like NDP-sugar epimerase
VQTNVIGSNNVVTAALSAGVRRVVALSTDKAAAPVNLYGATKLCADKIFIAANNIRGSRDVRFTVVRYGNVLGSRGSVVPYFLKKRSSGVLPITHREMTRFNILLREGVEMVLWALENGQGGEVFVPKIPSYRIMDLARAIGPECEYPIVGIRPGEKVHEEMITTSDSHSTVEFDGYFAILPRTGRELEEYRERTGARSVAKGFAYNSGTNESFLTVEEIRELVKGHLDSTFDA